MTEFEERLVVAAESIASSMAVIAGVVDEVYREQATEEAERMRTVSARDVVRQPPSVPRPRAQL